MKIFRELSITKYPKILPLTIFKKASFRQLLTKKNRIWRVPSYRAARFKSFFAFLKIKPFIIRMRYSLLKNFIMNPRKITLSTFITLSKKYKISQIDHYFQAVTKFMFISKKQLRFLVLKINPKKKKKISFELFKYKLFAYTTPAKSKLIFEPVYSHLRSIDFRTGLVNMCRKKRFPNVSTLSTYNWRIVN